MPNFTGENGTVVYAKPRAEGLTLVREVTKANGLRLGPSISSEIPKTLAAPQEWLALQTMGSFYAAAFSILAAHWAIVRLSARAGTGRLK